MHLTAIYFVHQQCDELGACAVNTLIICSVAVVTRGSNVARSVTASAGSPMGPELARLRHGANCDIACGSPEIVQTLG